MPLFQYDYDPEKCVELGNAWVKLGDDIMDALQALTQKFIATQWTGFGGAWAQTVWDNSLYPTVLSAAQTCWQIGEAIQKYGQALVKELHDAWKQVVAEILGFLFGALLGYALSGLGLILGELTEVGALVEDMIAAISRLIPTMGRVGQAAGFVAKISADLGAQIVLGEMGNAMGQKIMDLPYHVTGKNIGYDVLTGTPFLMHHPYSPGRGHGGVDGAPPPSVPVHVPTPPPTYTVHLNPSQTSLGSSHTGLDFSGVGYAGIVKPGEGPGLFTAGPAGTGRPDAGTPLGANPTAVKPVADLGGPRPGSPGEPLGSRPTSPGLPGDVGAVHGPGAGQPGMAVGARPGAPGLSADAGAGTAAHGTPGTAADVGALHSAGAGGHTGAVTGGSPRTGTSSAGQGRPAEPTATSARGNGAATGDFAHGGGTAVPGRSGAADGGAARPEAGTPAREPVGTPVQATGHPAPQGEGHGPAGRGTPASPGPDRAARGAANGAPADPVRRIPSEAGPATGHEPVDHAPSSAGAGDPAAGARSAGHGTGPRPEPGRDTGASTGTTATSARNGEPGTVHAESARAQDGQAHSTASRSATPGGDAGRNLTPDGRAHAEAEPPETVPAHAQQARPSSPDPTTGSGHATSARDTGGKQPTGADRGQGRSGGDPASAGQGSHHAAGDQAHRSHADHPAGRPDPAHPTAPPAAPAHPATRPADTPTRLGHDGPAPTDSGRNTVARQRNWDRALEGLDRAYARRFAYEHRQELVRHAAAARIDAALRDTDLSPAGRDRVRQQFVDDAAAAYWARREGNGVALRLDKLDPRHPDRSAAPGRGFPEHFAQLADSIPQRVERERLWEAHADLAGAVFDRVYAGHPDVLHRAEELGPDPQLLRQRRQMREDFDAALRRGFDRTMDRTSVGDRPQAADRLTGDVADGISHGITLHLRRGRELDRARDLADQARSQHYDHLSDRTWRQVHEDLDHTVRTGFERAHGRPFEGRSRAQGPARRAFTAGPGLVHRIADRAAAGEDLRFHADLAAQRHAERREAGGLEPDLSPEGRRQVTDDFVRSGLQHFDEHFRGRSVRDQEAWDAWQQHLDDQAEVLDAQFDHRAAFDRDLSQAQEHFDRYAADLLDPATEGRPVTDHQLQRLAAEFQADLRQLHQAVHQRGSGERAQRRWQRVRDRLVADLPHRFTAETRLTRALDAAAEHFHAVERDAAPLTGQRSDHLAQEYRSQAATRHEEIWNRGGRDITWWLDHERTHGDAFGTRLGHERELDPVGQDPTVRPESREHTPDLAGPQERALHDLDRHSRQTRLDAVHRLRDLDAPGHELGHANLADRVAPAVHARVRDLRLLARELGVHDDHFKDTARHLQQALREEDLQAAATHLTLLHDRVETAMLDRRLADFNTHAEGGGWRLLEPLGARERDWHSHVLRVREAERHGDPAALAHALDRYDAFVEQHVPDQALRGADRPRRFDALGDDIASALARTGDPAEQARLQHEWDQHTRDTQRVLDTYDEHTHPEYRPLLDRYFGAVRQADRAHAREALDAMRTHLQHQARIRALSRPDTARPPQRDMTAPRDDAQVRELYQQLTGATDARHRNDLITRLEELENRPADDQALESRLDALDPHHWNDPRFREQRHQHPHDGSPDEALATLEQLHEERAYVQELRERRDALGHHEDHTPAGTQETTAAEPAAPAHSPARADTQEPAPARADDPAPARADEPAPPSVDDLRRRIADLTDPATDPELHQLRQEALHRSAADKDTPPHDGDPHGDSRALDDLITHQQLSEHQHAQRLAGRERELERQLEEQQAHVLRAESGTPEYRAAVTRLLELDAERQNLRSGRGLADDVLRVTDRPLRPPAKAGRLDRLVNRALKRQAQDIAEALPHVPQDTPQASARHDLGPARTHQVATGTDSHSSADHDLAEAGAPTAVAFSSDGTAHEVGGDRLENLRRRLLDLQDEAPATTQPAAAVPHASSPQPRSYAALRHRLDLLRDDATPEADDTSGTPSGADGSAPAPGIPGSADGRPTTPEGAAAGAHPLGNARPDGDQTPVPSHPQEPAQQRPDARPSADAPHERDMPADRGERQTRPASLHTDAPPVVEHAGESPETHLVPDDAWTVRDTAAGTTAGQKSSAIVDDRWPGRPDRNHVAEQAPPREQQPDPTAPSQQEHVDPNDQAQRYTATTTEKPSQPHGRNQAQQGDRHPWPDDTSDDQPTAAPVSPLPLPRGLADVHGHGPAQDRGTAAHLRTDSLPPVLPEDHTAASGPRTPPGTGPGTVGAATASPQDDPRGTGSPPGPGTVQGHAGIAPADVPGPAPRHDLPVHHEPGPLNPAPTHADTGDHASSQPPRHAEEGNDDGDRTDPGRHDDTGSGDASGSKHAAPQEDSRPDAAAGQPAEHGGQGHALDSPAGTGAPHTSTAPGPHGAQDLRALGQEPDWQSTSRAMQRQLGAPAWQGLVRRSSAVIQRYVVLDPIPGHTPLADDQEAAVVRVAVAMATAAPERALEEAEGAAMRVAQEWVATHPDRIRQYAVDRMRAAGRVHPEVLARLKPIKRVPAVGGAWVEDVPEAGPSTSPLASTSATTTQMQPVTQEPIVHATGTGTLAAGGSGGETVRGRPGEPVPLDRLARAMGVPRHALPGVDQVVREIRGAVEQHITLVHGAGTQVADVDGFEWSRLPQQLLGNYRWLVAGSGGDRPAGLPLTIGPAEVLISFDPGAVHRVENPDAVGYETVNGSFRTGGHSETHAGVTGTTRATIGGSATLTVGGVAPFDSVYIGGSLTLTANQNSRSNVTEKKTEQARVADTRANASLVVAKDPTWTVRLRFLAGQRWTDPDIRRIVISPAADAARERGAGAGTLQLRVSDHYLSPDPDPADLVTAVRDGEPGNAHPTLPPVFHISGLTGLPELLDAIHERVRTALGPARAHALLGLGSVARTELQQQLWNLDANLADAARGDYWIPLHDHRGRPGATVVISSELLGGPTPVGASSDKAHLENVRTVVDAGIAGHTIQNSWELTAPAVEFRLALPEVGGKKLGLGVGGDVKIVGSDSDALTSKAINVHVMVERQAGTTTGYRTRWQHRATVYLPNRNEGLATEPVTGEALLRVPEAQAHAHGFPVRRAAFTTDPGPVGQVAYRPDDLAETATGADDPVSKPAPSLLRTGHLPQLSLVHVHQAMVDQVWQWLRHELAPHGFLPPQGNPFTGRSGHDNELASQMDNLGMLRMMVSTSGFEAHAGQLLGDGLRLYLRRRRGVLGVDLDTDTAELTLRLVPEGPAPTYQGTTNQAHAVTLDMGIDGADLGVSGGRSATVEGKFKVSWGRLRSAIVGVGLRFADDAGNTVSHSVNTPQLMEYQGRLDQFDLPVRLEAAIRFQHSGRLHGAIAAGSRDPQPLLIPHQRLRVLLPPVQPAPPGAWVSADPTPPHVLDKAVIYHFDTTGARGAALAALGEQMLRTASLTRPIADSFTGSHSLISHAKDIFAAGEGYGTDAPMQPGWFWDTHGVMGVKGTLGHSTFVGTFDEKFVSGVISHGNTKVGTSAGRTRALNLGLADITVGDKPGAVVVAGELSVGAGWTWGQSSASGITSGSEAIQVAYGQLGYLFRTDTTLRFLSHQAEIAKLLPNAYATTERVLTDRELIYVLPETYALEEYAAGHLPVPPAQLADVVDRWTSGRTPLGGTLVARLLLRWHDHPQEVPPGTDLAGLAARLSDQHHEAAAPVADHAVRRRFNQVFRSHQLDDPAHPNLAEYLTRQDEGGFMLGPAGLHSRLVLDSDETLHQAVVRGVRQVAPDLLSQQAVLVEGRRMLGTVQGATNVLRAVFGHDGGRAVIERALGANDHTVVYRVAHPIGWLLEDQVCIAVEVRPESVPTPVDTKHNTGLEFFGHTYADSSTTSAQGRSQSVTVGKYAVSGTSANGNLSLGLGAGSETSVTRSQDSVAQKHFADWGGVDVLTMRLKVDLRVFRLPRGGRFLVDNLTSAYRRLAGARPFADTFHGTVVLQVPRSLTHTEPADLRPPLRSPVPFPPMEDHDFIVGLTVPGIRQAGRELLARLYRTTPDSPLVESSRILSDLLSDTTLAGHLPQATRRGGALLAASHIFPGRSSDRVTLNLHATIHDLRIVGRVKGAGTGRAGKQGAGVSVSSRNTTWQPSLTGGFGVDMPLHRPHHPNDAAEIDPSAKRTADLAGVQGGSASHRVEQALKETAAEGHGGQVLAVFRVNCHLTATRRHAPLLGRKERSGDRQRSEPVQGHMYVLLHADHLDKVQAGLEQAHRRQRSAGRRWAEPWRFDTFDLARLLAQATARPGVAAVRTAEVLARLIREQRPSRPGAPRTGLLLRLDRDSWMRESRLERHELPPTTLHSPPDAVLAAGTTPWQLNPVYLARDLAVLLDVPVRLDLYRSTEATSAERSWWASPRGRLHVFDPADLDPGHLRTDEATAHGLLSAEQVRAVAHWAVTDEDLARLYATSWDTQHTLAQAVDREIQQRRTRLNTLGAPLVDILERANAAEASWAGRINELQQQVEALTLTHAQLGQAQEYHRDAVALVSELQRLARSPHATVTPEALADYQTAGEDASLADILERANADEASWAGIINELEQQVARTPEALTHAQLGQAREHHRDAVALASELQLLARSPHATVTPEALADYQTRGEDLRTPSAHSSLQETPLQEEPLQEVGPGQGVDAGEQTGLPDPVAPPPLQEVGPGQGVDAGEQTGLPDPVAPPPLQGEPLQEVGPGQGVDAGEQTGLPDPVAPPPLQDPVPGVPRRLWQDELDRLAGDAAPPSELPANVPSTRRASWEAYREQLGDYEWLRDEAEQRDRGEGSSRSGGALPDSLWGEVALSAQELARTRANMQIWGLDPEAIEEQYATWHNTHFGGAGHEPVQQVTPQTSPDEALPDADPVALQADGQESALTPEALAGYQTRGEALRTPSAHSSLQETPLQGEPLQEVGPDQGVDAGEQTGLPDPVAPPPLQDPVPGVPRRLWQDELDRLAGDAPPPSELPANVPSTRRASWEAYRLQLGHYEWLRQQAEQRDRGEGSSRSSGALPDSLWGEVALSEQELARTRANMQIWGLDPEAIEEQYATWHNTHLGGTTGRVPSPAPQPAQVQVPDPVQQVTPQTSPDEALPDADPVALQADGQQETPGEDGTGGQAADLHPQLWAGFLGLPPDLLVFDFAEGSTVLSAVEVDRVRDLARALADLRRQWEAEHGSVPLPLIITVSVGGNGSRRPMADREARGHTVGRRRGTYLRDLLHRELDRWPGQRFTINPVSRGRQLDEEPAPGQSHAQARRRAILSFAAPRAVAQDAGVGGGEQQDRALDGHLGPLPQPDASPHQDDQQNTGVRRTADADHTPEANPAGSGEQPLEAEGTHVGEHSGDAQSLDPTGQDHVEGAELAPRTGGYQDPEHSGRLLSEVLDHGLTVDRRTRASRPPELPFVREEEEPQEIGPRPSAADTGRPRVRSLDQGSSGRFPAFQVTARSPQVSAEQQAWAERLADDLAKVAHEHESRGELLPRVVVRTTTAHPGLRSARTAAALRSHSVAHMLRTALSGTGRRWVIGVDTSPHPAAGLNTDRPAVPLPADSDQHIQVELLPHDPAQEPFEDPTAPPPPSHPWYVDHGAMGEATVVGVTAASAETARGWARAAARQVNASPYVRRSLEDALTAVLQEPDLERWQEWMASGIPVVVPADRPAASRSADGRTRSTLIWMHPRPRRLRPAAMEGRSDGVQEYSVSFATTSASRMHTTQSALSLEGALLGLVTLGSAALSSLAVGTPQIGGGTVTSRGEGDRTNVLGGRKPYLDKRSLYRGGLGVDFFVDGERQDVRMVFPVDLDVTFPVLYTGTDLYRPVADVAPQDNSGSGQARSTGTQEFINAVATGPLVAGLHRELLARGLTPEQTVAVAAQLSEILVEGNIRNRNRALLGGQVLTQAITGVPGFRGRASAQATIEAAQLVNVIDRMRIRNDMGVGRAGVSVRGRRGDSGLALGINFGGLGGPHHAGELSGLAPLQARFGRTLAKESEVVERTLVHSVVTSRGRMADYRAAVRLDVKVFSPDLGVVHVAVTVPASIGVAWEDGQGARAWERDHFGRPFTPALAASGPVALPGPVEARPYVRALLAAARPLTVRPLAESEAVTVADERPGVLRSALNLTVPSLLRRTPSTASIVSEQAPPTGRPAAGEPDVLAARRGLGFALAVALPGSELVSDRIADALGQALGSREKLNQSDIARQLSEHYGRVTLEADLAELLHGKARQVGQGGREFRIAVRAELLDHQGSQHHDLTVNTRVLSASSVGGAKTTERSVHVAVGGGADLDLGPVARLRFGGFQLQAGPTLEEKKKQTSTVSQYHRIETAGGVEHRYGVQYHVHIAELRGQDLRLVAEFRVEHPDLVAQVVVPEHIPYRTLTDQSADDALGTAVTADQVDAGRPEVALGRHGTAGVYPAFLAGDDLPQLIAQLRTELLREAGVNASQWGSWTDYPPELLHHTQPSALAAALGALTGDGHWLALPHDGHRLVFRIRLRALDPRDVRPTTGPVEIEHYTQSVDEHSDEHTLKWDRGISGSIGPILHVGHTNAHTQEGADGHAEHVQHHSGPPARIVIAGRAGASGSSGSGTAKRHGNISVRRVTYGDEAEKYLVRTRASFEVTGYVWRPRPLSHRLHQMTRHLEVPGGLDLLVPASRLADLLGDHVPDPVNAQLPTVGDRDLRAHALGTVLTGTAYVEHLHADGVADAVLDRLERHGALRTRSGEFGPRPNRLVRSIRQALSAQALADMAGDLLRGGATRWFVDGDWFYEVTVRTRELGAPVKSVLRPDDRLTLRTEDLREDSTITSQGSHTVAGGAFQTRLGGHHGHGGFEFGGGWLGREGTKTENATKTTTIHRGNPADGLVAFTHPLVLEVSVAGHRLLHPLLALPASGVRTAAFRMGDAVGAGPATREVWRSRMSADWQDSGTGAAEGIHGTVTLLVPEHLTVPAGPEAPPFRFLRAPGTSPRWAAPWQQAPDPDAVALPDSFVDALFPWDLPAVHAVRRWAQVAASGPEVVVRPDGTVHGPVPHLDAASAAHQAYLLATGAELLPNVARLLRHAFVVPVGRASVRVGLALTRARYLGPQEGARYKARIYSQQDEEPKVETERERGWYVEGGGEGGGLAGHESMLGWAPLRYERVRADAAGGALGHTDEKNRVVEAAYRYVEFDGVLVMEHEADPRRSLRVQVPHALVAMVRADVGGEAGQELEGMLRRLTGEALHRPADGTDTPTVPPHRSPGQEAAFGEVPIVVVEPAEQLAPPGLPASSAADHVRPEFEDVRTGPAGGERVLEQPSPQGSLASDSVGVDAPLAEVPERAAEAPGGPGPGVAAGVPPLREIVVDEMAQLLSAAADSVAWQRLVDQLVQRLGEHAEAGGAVRMRLGEGVPLQPALRAVSDAVVRSGVSVDVLRGEAQVARLCP